MGMYEAELDKKEKQIQWSTDRCDKMDYLIAAFCGLAAGIVDSFLVGTPGLGRLGKLTDEGADQLVKKAADMLWKGDGRSFAEGKPRHAPDSLEKAISYLEQSFPVNYDARYAPDLLNTDGALASMTPRNHHIKSLAHSPDIVGVIFSIIDQFTGAASFLDNGKLIRLVPVRDARNRKVMYMYGTRFESKIFCGICNWLGHLASDLCGSSSTRKEGKIGRGSGLPIPFYELFLTMNFGSVDGESFAQVAVKVFEEGYDLRHGAAMAVPALIEELSIKVIWALKRHFYARKPWSECIPSSAHANLRMMLLVGNATLCMVDGIDAAIRTGMSGGNPITFILHLNLIAWGRLILLIFRELEIRYGGKVNQAVQSFFAEAGLNDRYVLQQYYERMHQLDSTQRKLIQEIVAEVEKEFAVIAAGVDKSLNPLVGTPEQRRIESVKFARGQNVEEGRIFKTADELREWMKS